jgi:CheY-like chemotaxis protein
MALPNQLLTKTISAADDAMSNLLIIEDNVDLCKHLQAVFAGHLHCDFAHDGQSGIEKAVEIIPDAIICDVMLPRINGFEVTRQLKQDDRTCHIPVIMLTARVDEDSRIKGLKTLADDYLAKPFSEAELRQRVDTLLAVREILRDRFSKEIDRSGLDPFKASLTEHDRRFIERVEKVLEQDYSEPDFSTSQFANGVAMSERQLQRKLKAIMNYSPREYLRNFRLKKAMKLLESGSSVADAAYSAGFTSLSYFAKCFKAQFGLTPSQVFEGRQGTHSTPG